MRQLDFETQQLIEKVIAAVKTERRTKRRTSTKGTPPLYWRVGKHLSDAVGTNMQSDDARRTIGCVAQAIATRYGTEFSPDELLTMAAFTRRFPDYEHVVTLCKEFTWEHFKKLVHIDDDIKRDFYSWMALVKKWDVQTLATKIDEGTYEKTPRVTELENSKDVARTVDDYEAALMSALVSHDPELIAFLKTDDTE